MQNDCVVLRWRICEGDNAHPMGIMKSNSSKVRHEEQQVVQPGQVLELVVLHVGEFDLWVTTGKRISDNLRACLNADLAWWKPSEPQKKNHRVNFIISFLWSAIYIHKLFTFCSYV